MNMIVFFESNKLDMVNLWNKRCGCDKCFTLKSIVLSIYVNFPSYLCPHHYFHISLFFPYRRKIPKQIWRLHVNRIGTWNYDFQLDGSDSMLFDYSMEFPNIHIISSECSELRIFRIFAHIFHACPESRVGE